jgi:hypothetical protein
LAIAIKRNRKVIPEKTDCKNKPVKLGEIKNSVIAEITKLAKKKIMKDKIMNCFRDKIK